MKRLSIKLYCILTNKNVDYTALDTSATVRVVTHFTLYRRQEHWQCASHATAAVQVAVQCGQLQT